MSEFLSVIGVFVLITIGTGKIAAVIWYKKQLYFVIILSINKVEVFIAIKKIFLFFINQVTLFLQISLKFCR